MRVSEIIEMLMNENPHTNVVIHTDGEGWTMLDNFESANDPKTEVIVPSFTVDSDAIEYIDLDGVAPDAITPNNGWKHDNGVTWISPNEGEKPHNILERRAENRRLNQVIIDGREGADAHECHVEGDHDETPSPSCPDCLIS